MTPTPLNLLFTSPNWRAGVVRCFRESFDRLPGAGRVLTVDSDPLAAAAYAGDAHQSVPLYASDAYAPTLRSWIESQGIALVIPSTDRDCRYFTEHPAVLEGTGARILLSPPELAQPLLDKLPAAALLQRHGIRTPQTWLPADAPAAGEERPLLVKPRRDSGSQFTHAVRQANHQEALLGMREGLCVQEYIPGQEYSVDLLTDWDGSLIGAVPRIRLATKGGTSIQTATVRHPGVLAATRRLCEALRPVGLLCAQFIEHAVTGEIVCIELNLRYGSGLPLSIEAGLDAPKLILQMHAGEHPRLADDCYEPDLHLLYSLAPTFLRRDEIHDDRRAL